MGGKIVEIITDGEEVHRVPFKFLHFRRLETK